MKSVVVLLLLSLISSVAQPIDIGSRRELFTDDHIIQKLEGEIDLTPVNWAIENETLAG